MKSSDSETALKDIRKIVSGRSSSRPRKGSKHSIKENDDVLELTDIVEDRKSSPEGGSKATKKADISVELISKAKGAQAQSSITEARDFMNRLRRTKKLKQGLVESKIGGNGIINTSMEEVVMALLKQPLTQWLDENLDSIVRDIVRESVEKEITKIMDEDQ